MNDRGHVPVLLHEVLRYLDVAREGTYIDGTIGLGGHSLEILRQNPRASLIGLDVDELALNRVKEMLLPFADRALLYQADYRCLPELGIDFSAVRGLLLDLGMSSFQLDTPERGFSFNREGPLDMRMDLRNKTTASRIIETYSEPKLAHLFQEYGELRQARRLAREIVARRKVRKFETTVQLRQLIEQVCHWVPQKGKIHPAAKVFQALRIEVNHELQGMGDFLETMVGLILRGTRCVVISFHSLEDRIVKRTFARLSGDDNGPAILRLLTRKPVTPTEEEMAVNARSKAAKLRAAEKV
jgi:16S rRNA (cytosine1402-N4)-methyltransferase